MIENPYKDVYLVFALVPLLPAIILFLLGYLRYVKRRDWEKTEAVTVADDKFGLGYPKPIVRYEVNGVVYEQQSGIGQRPHLPGGRRVEVFYNPDNPKEMIINTFMQRGTFLFFVGSIFLIFAIFSFIYMLLMQSFYERIL